MIDQNNYFTSDVLPFIGKTGKGDDMRIVEIGRDPSGMKKYMVHHSIRRPGKKTPDHIKRVAIGSTGLANTIAEIKEMSAGGSLKTKTFAECSEYYEKHIGYKSQKATFFIEKKELGKYRVDDRFVMVYQEYISKISSERATNTVNNYRICVRSVLNYCYRSRFIQDQPIRDFGLKPIEERDRIWSNDERTALYNEINRSGSHLYWSVRFAEKNPIRGESDLWKLTRDDLVLFGEMAPCIRFDAQKTGNNTFLIEIDRDILDQFQWKIKNIPDCPYLFPRFWQDDSGAWSWAPMGSPVKHWRTLCRNAKISDFHFHDLRHVATTYMLEKRDENGNRVYDEDDFKSLGIFYSTKAVEIYRNRKAERVIERVRRSAFVGLKTDQNCFSTTESMVETM